MATLYVVIFSALLILLVVLFFVFREIFQRLSALEQADHDKFPYRLRVGLEELKVPLNYSKFERFDIRQHLRTIETKLDAMDAHDAKFDQQYAELNGNRK